MNMKLDKIRKIIFNICDAMELVLALAVVVGIIIAAIAIVPAIGIYWESKTEAGTFLEFLDVVFTVVIGTEFLKMLCKPNAVNIIEALIFVSARHLIMQSPDAVDTLLFIIGICILFVFQKFMEDTYDHENSLMKKLKYVLGSRTEETGQSVSQEEFKDSDAKF